MRWNEQPGRSWGRPLRHALFMIILSLTGASACGGGGASSSLGTGPGLRGFNLGAKGQTPFAEKDYADLVAYGANLVRVGVNVPLSESGATLDLPASEWEAMDRTVEMGRKHGFKVVLALVPLPLGEAAVHWNWPQLKANLVQVWARVAARFKGNPVIAGYDLVNEPVIPRDRSQPSLPGLSPKNPGWVSGMQEQGGDHWRELAVKIIEAIRAVDADSLIIFEPSPWALPKAFSQLIPLPFSRVVYSFHFYEPHALTHQGLYEHKAALNYPSERTSRASLSSALEPVRAFSRKYSVPIFVGEFSIVRWAPGDSAARYLSDAIELFEAEGWNWAYHSFREYEGWDAELDHALPRGEKSNRSENSRTIRLLVEKGFSKNPPGFGGR